MQTTDLIRMLSGLLGILGFIPYIIAVLKGETRPQKSSWIAWAILNFITLLGMYTKHTAITQMACITIGSWVVAGLAFKYGKPGWTIWDKLCLIGALAAISLWKLFGDSNFGIGVSLVGLLVSGIPIWISAWQTPEKENKIAWIIFLISSILALATIEKRTFASMAQPIEFIINQAVTVCFLFIRPASTK